MRDIRIKVAGTMRFIIDFAFLPLGAQYVETLALILVETSQGKKERPGTNGRAPDFKMLRYQVCDPYQSSISFLA